MDNGKRNWEQCNYAKKTVRQRATVQRGRLACATFRLRRPHLALDSQQQPLLVIPAAQIISTISSESAGDWIVRVRGPSTPPTSTTVHFRRAPRARR